MDKNTKPERLTVSVSEAAALLGISIPSAYRLVKTPGFPVVYIGSRMVIPRDALNDWLNREVAKKTGISA